MAEKTSKRSGVALIIVLGLVAILMIVSVAFSIHMRIERAGAANLRHAGVARQIVKGGMAAALAAIDCEVGDAVVPPWYNTNDVQSLIYGRKESWRQSGGGQQWETHYFWKNTFVSYDTNATEHVTASIFSPEAGEYFPGGLAYGGFAKKYIRSGDTEGGTDILQPQWLPVYSDIGEDSVMGRFAFFVVDTTGMLDVCCMTNGASARWMGRDPGEMAVVGDLLPEVTDATRFANKNRQNGTYVNLAELQKMNPYVENCRSFNTFSYDPAPTNDLVYIGGNAADIRSRKDEIISAFYDCGLTAGKSFGTKDCEQARWAYLGLVDYVDADDTMEDDDKVKPWERPATENIPLVSGFMAKLTVQRREHVKKVGEDGNGNPTYEKDPANCEMKLTAEFKVPFVYPFVDLYNPAACQLEGKATVAAGDCCGEPFFSPVEGGLFPYDPFSDDMKDVVSKKVEFEEAQSGDNSLVAGLKIGSKDWCVIRNKESGTPRGLSDANDPLDVFLVAAGQTSGEGGQVQHRFPANASDYGSPFSDALKDYTWMTVPFNFNKEGVDFTDADEGPSEVVNGIECKTWKKEIVVWAEIFDPRFSSLSMARSMTWQSKRMYCRPSHSRLGDDYSPNGFHYTIPITKVKAEGGGKDHFSDFTAAGKVKVEDFDKNDTANDKVLPRYFGGYKDENGGISKSPYGATPLTSYVLAHPSAVRNVYRMNVDGIRIANGEEEKTTDRARMKWRAFVKNKPLESVGELGYLPIGMWYTIRLYDYGDSKVSFTKDPDAEITCFNHLPSDDDDDAPTFHPVLDYFTVVDYSKETVRGRVNVNTLNENVLATAFYRMPIGTEVDGNLTLWPDLGSSSARHRISLEGAKELAKALVDCREDGDFATLSDLGYIVARGEDGGPSVLYGDEDVSSPAIISVMNALNSGDDFGEFERESVVRNSCGLFTMRGQTFIIVVRGEAYSPMFGRKRSLANGTCNAAKTAIAQVWRDSEPDADGRHPVFIQFFKIIDD